MRFRGLVKRRIVLQTIDISTELDDRMGISLSFGLQIRRQVAPEGITCADRFRLMVEFHPFQRILRWFGNDDRVLLNSYIG